MRYQPKPVGSISGIIRGGLDYIFKPRIRRREIGSFNGQEFRQKIFHELVDKMNFSAIVETGTFRGETTHFMHQKSGLPLYTAELHPRFYAYARMRLRKDNDVVVYNSDSRQFLRRLITENIIHDDNVFIYLDAHWGEDLPLLEEIEIIFQELPGAVVMIDDFQVPWDDKYTYDDYGVGKALTMEYIEPAIRNFGLEVFFPALGAEEETGARRGCVLLAKTPEKSGLLKSMQTLKIYENSK
jgi:hypothetical protein